jgi:hypothetical protein
MAARRSTIEWQLPRRMRLRVRVEKKFSTAFSQDAEIGVKWNVQRGCRFSHACTFGCLCVAWLWVNLVSWTTFGRLLPAIQRLNAHAPHHCPYHLPPNHDALTMQQIG